jgi:NADH-quinone oxidoreductase subunit C
MSTLEKLFSDLQKHLANSATLKIAHDQITITLAPENLLQYCAILRDNPDLQFNQLMDVCGVDYLEYGVSEWATSSATAEGFSRGVMTRAPDHLENFPTRFAVVYQLLSTVLNHRVRLKVFVADEAPTIPSVVQLWRSANWFEREAYDLFGITFSGHPDLRRILTDYGFEGHPFRKDFPLIGNVEMRYDATQERCVYEPVSIPPRTLVPKVIRPTAPVPQSAQPVEQTEHV